MDERLEILADGETTASCGLWWAATPQLDGLRVGYIGRYMRSDRRAADRLLKKARATLLKAGCALAIGPVDGDTWHRYRFVTERGTHPPFLLEPDNPDEYVEDFEQAGFSSVAHYLSAEEDDLGYRDPRVARAAQRLSDSSVAIRAIDLGRFSAELDAIYDVATVSFARNFLYSPIARADFHDLNASLKPLVDPAFVRVAEHEGRMIGFAFAFLNAEGDTVVGKTQARLPDLCYAGLGAVLLDAVRRTAHERGASRIIHALIADGNIALNGSRRTARPFRGYTLYGSCLS